MRPYPQNLTIQTTMLTTFSDMHRPVAGGGGGGGGGVGGVPIPPSEINDIHNTNYLIQELKAS